jgi:biotin carboxylase
MAKEHQKELSREIQRVLDLLHMRTAVYNIETREGTDGKSYIMEISPRGGGNRLAECLRYATGVDMITNMVKYSVGMKVDDIIQQPYDGYWGEIILHSDKAGIFEKIWISDAIRKNIVEEDLWVESGDSIGGFTAANEAIGTLILKFENDTKLQEVLENQEKYVKVKLRESSKK